MIVEIKSGYGLSVVDEECFVCLVVEVIFEVIFFGVYVVFVEYVDCLDEYVDLVIGFMIDVCVLYVKWIDVFCEMGVFMVVQLWWVLEVGIVCGFVFCVYVSQFGLGEGVWLVVEFGVVLIDYGIYLMDVDIDVFVSFDIVFILLLGVEFLMWQLYLNV